MPRYFFHLYNDLEVEDEEGVDLADLETVRAEALKAARDLMAEDVRLGKLTLSHRIEVRDQKGEPVHTVRYGDAIQLRD